MWHEQTKIIVDHFSTLVISALSTNLKLQDLVRDDQKLSPTLYYAREWATVHINIGRRSGKSNFITKTLEDVENCVVIVPNKSMLSIYKWNPKVYTICNLHDVFAGLPPTLIIVDEPSMHKSLDEIYKIFAVHNGYQQFLLLGE